MRNLTQGEWAILDKLRDGAELDHARPGGWWIGTKQVSASVCHRLRWLLLISIKGNERGEIVQHYRINERGLLALTDPASVVEL